MGRMGNNSRIIDISPTISARTAVFPGDTAFGREVALEFGKGDNLTLSSIRSTLHIGAHADAPIHYHRDGEAIAERSMDYYLGACQVVSVQAAKGARITPEQFREALGPGGLRAPRILLRTGSFPDPDKWTDDFCSYSPELIQKLADQGVVLIGIDTPSIDPSQDKELLSHQVVFRNNLAVLEGIVLDEVSDGLYVLIALPLKIEGADASPVRAVLLEG